MDFDSHHQTIIDEFEETYSSRLDIIEMLSENLKSMKSFSKPETDHEYIRRYYLAKEEFSCLCKIFNITTEI